MIDKEINRKRTKEHRLKLVNAGYKEFKIFLPPSAIQKLTALRRHFEIKKNTQLLSKILDEQFKKIPKNERLMY